MFLFIFQVKISLAMKKAIIRVKNRQYEVVEGDEVLMERITDSKVEPEVLLIVDDKDKVEIGHPVLDKAKVALEILGQVKGEKLDILKYKAKSRYRKRYGFRPLFTKVRVKEIKLA